MRHLIAVLRNTTALITAPVALAAGDAAKGKTNSKMTREEINAVANVIQGLHG